MIRQPPEQKTKDKLRNRFPSSVWGFESVIFYLLFFIGKTGALLSARLIPHREIQLPPSGGQDDTRERKVLYEDSKDCRLNLSRFISGQFHCLRRRVRRRRPWWRRVWWGRPWWRRVWWGRPWW